ncbi:MAG: hypothetical protein JKX70_01575, partial [Phycisphaerales bacterium]|nr:hypothetical protein [Phycisphaerales bacterium]
DQPASRPHWQTSEQLQRTQDSITTRNSDVIKGFIESIGTSTLIEGENDIVKVNISDIQSITLANFPQLSEGIYLSTNDDLRLRVSSFDFDFQHPLTVEIDAESIGLAADKRNIWLLSPDAPVGLDVVSTNTRVISLSTITPELIEPTGDRDWTPTPRAIINSANPVLSTVDLRAPVRVVYPLPKGSSRFACTLIAPINTWTDCIAMVYSISYDGQRTELLNQQLNAAHPSHEINVALNENTEKIEIRIDPGEYGPIQDRVLLQYPRVLVEQH